MSAIAASDGSPQPGPVTVLGGSGYLGSAIVAELARRGVPARIAARHPQHVAEPPRTAETVAADVTDPGSLAAALAGSSAVINAVGRYVESRAATFAAVHVTGAARVAAAAHTTGIPLVHISGIGTDPRSRSPYVRARAHGEDAVRAACPTAIVLRPSVLFGGNDGFRSALRGLARLPVVPLFGDGSVRLQPVHVADVAAAAVAATARPDLAGRVLDLGGAGCHAYAELVRSAAGGRRQWQLPIPFVVWRGLARVLQRLPAAPLSYDQVVLMERDNVVAAERNGFAALGIAPRPFSLDEGGAA